MKPLRYSKFPKDSATKALRLVAQILGDDKIQKAPAAGKDSTTSDKDQQKEAANKDTAPMFREVVFDNFFGQDVKEILRVAFTNVPVDKVFGILVGPKTAVYGWESMLSNSGCTRLEWVANWEDNKSVSPLVVQSRRLAYVVTDQNRIRVGRELVDSWQSYVLQKG